MNQFSYSTRTQGTSQRFLFVSSDFLTRQCSLIVVSFHASPQKTVADEKENRKPQNCWDNNIFHNLLCGELLLSPIKVCKIQMYPCILCISLVQVKIIKVVG